MKEQTLVLSDGFRVAVTTAGDPDNPPLVLLHGLTVSASAYTELIEELAERGWYVVAPDAADHGGTDSLPWGHTVADMADVLARALTSLNIEQAIIAGHSMGGGLAVEFAALYPERAVAVVLLDAAAGKEHHEGIAVAPGPSVPLRAVRIAPGGLVDVLGDGYTAMRSRSHTERLSLLSILKGSVSGCRCFRAAYALMQADTVPLLKQLRSDGVPTAVVHGEYDQIIPLAAGLSAARLAGGDFYTVEGGFHSWMLADPDFAADIIGIALGVLSG